MSRPVESDHPSRYTVDMIRRAIQIGAAAEYVKQPPEEVWTDAYAAVFALEAEIKRLREQVEELEDRNHWRWPNERERRFKAEAALEELVDVVLRDELKPIALRQRARAVLAVIREESGELIPP